MVAGFIRRVSPGARLTVAPLADGGEGTAAVLAGILGLRPGVYEGVDALMRPRKITYYSDGPEPTVCAVDAAEFVGLAMMGDDASPWRMSSWPIGEFLAAMFAAGCRKVYLAVGGTATVDGGAGLLQALGYSFYDAAGRELPVPLLPGRLPDVCAVVPPEPEVRRAFAAAVTAFVDVDVPLLPSADAGMSSLSFARQKGVADEDLPLLEAALRRLASVVRAENGEAAGQGAGGGIGYAVGAVAGAGVEMGAGALLGMSGIADGEYDMIVTGEGSFDSQSMAGKLAGTLIGLGESMGIPVLVVAGTGASGNLPENVTLLTSAPWLPEGAALTRESALESLEKGLAHFF